ncbi:MAG: type I methionyl aminopeptidase [Ignavibacteria bacterium GWF2_33_9]|nr:MAG: type I methionyl aminopeptidase [Ignavibacteria bacterium GWF2_33_9]
MGYFKFNTDEFKFFERANRIVAETLSLMQKHVKPGVTTYELDKIAEDYIRTQNAEPAFKGYGPKDNPFPATVCTSVDNVIVHGIPNKTPLLEGQIVSLDVGAKYKGFFGDSAITCFVGEVSPEIARQSEVTEQSLFKGLEQAVERKKIYDISRAIQTYVESNGYSLTRELVGHGIGKKLHDDPPVPNFVPLLLHRGDYPNWKLQQGLALSIEPMVHMGKKETSTLDDGWTVVTRDGSIATHWEHTVVIDQGKPIIMTLRN